MTQQHAATPGLSRKLFKISLPVLVLTIAGLVAWQITASSPRAHRRAPEAQPRLVEVQPVTREDIRVTISGLGTVIASRKLTLYPEVSGQIRQLRDNLLPGSQVRQGETLVRIDVAEYEIQRQKQQAEVALAEAELQKERGQQAIARQEYELIGRTLSPAQEALVLRQPELASAKARLVQAEAALAQATLALERTRIKAPFNAQVTQRSVETGSQVGTGS
nr:hypothetical protein [Endozoicomonas sp.]